MQRQLSRVLASIVLLASTVVAAGAGRSGNCNATAASPPQVAESGGGSEEGRRAMGSNTRAQTSTISSSHTTAHSSTSSDMTTTPVISSGTSTSLTSTTSTTTSVDAETEVGYENTTVVEAVPMKRTSSMAHFAAAAIVASLLGCALSCIARHLKKFLERASIILACGAQRAQDCLVSNCNNVVLAVRDARKSRDGRGISSAAVHISEEETEAEVKAETNAQGSAAGTTALPGTHKCFHLCEFGYKSPVEFYQPNGHWVSAHLTAVVSVGIAKGITSVSYRVCVDKSGSLFENVAVDTFRLPMEPCEPVEVLMRKPRPHWHPGHVHLRHARDFQVGAIEYEVRLQYMTSSSVLHRVAASRVRRRFVPGMAVQAFLGPFSGWKPARIAHEGVRFRPQPRLMDPLSDSSPGGTKKEPSAEMDLEFRMGLDVDAELCDSEASAIKAGHDHPWSAIPIVWDQASHQGLLMPSYHVRTYASL